MQYLQDVQLMVKRLLESCSPSNGRKFLIDFSTLLYGLCNDQVNMSAFTIENYSNTIQQIWCQLPQLKYPFDKPLSELAPLSLLVIEDALLYIQTHGTTRKEISMNFFNCMLESMNQARLISDFITPVALANMMAQMISPKNGDRVFDPTCGSGRLLIAASVENPSVLLTGMDRDVAILSIAFFNLYFNGCTEASLICQNFLNASHRDMDCDVILSNPPYEDNALSTVDFVDNILKALKQGGRCGILVPEGFLTHTANTTVIKMRKWLLFENCIQAVISLPKKIYKPYTISKSSLIILKKEKPDAGHMLFFSLLPEFEGSETEFSDTVYEQDMQRIVSAWQQRAANQSHGPATTGDFYWTADLDNIQKQNYILAAENYRNSEYFAPQVQLEEIHRNMRRKQQELNELLKGIL